MKVSKCSEKKVEEAAIPALSWDEMVRRDGVYRTNAHDSAHFVVFTETSMDSAVLLYIDGSNELLPANKEAWKREQFIRCNLTVCFELKAG